MLIVLVIEHIKLIMLCYAWLDVIKVNMLGLDMIMIDIDNNMLIWTCYTHLCGVYGYWINLI